MVPDRTIYVGSFDNNLYAIADGGQGSVTKKWAFPIGGRMYGSPAIGADGTIYVGSGDDNLYALTDNGSMGTPKWRFLTGGRVYFTPAIGARGATYKNSNDRHLFALTAATASALEKM